MGRITVEMLRKRAEHNEGCLSTLKEVALHQQEIEKIELIGDSCRQLEILYLCNNYIGKIEGLRHLKWLKYLNLAVNNIVRIEGLEGCESLERLDLTLNFVADLTTVTSLEANPFLEMMHLTGNPCTRNEGYRAFVIHALPQLKELDGEVIVRSERITARQAEDVVTEVVREDLIRVRESERIKQEMIEKGIDPFPAQFNEQGERVYGHTPEERLQILREQQAHEAELKAKAAEPAAGSISALHKELNKKQVRLTPEEEFAKHGRYLMRNEAKVPFTIDQDDPEEVTVTVQPGKFISTTLLNVAAEVNVIRVYIKGKLLQLPIDVELAPDSARVQRSATTGELKIIVPLTAAAKESRRGGFRAKLAATYREVESGLDAQAEEPAKKKEQGGAEEKTQTLEEKQAALRSALLFPEDSSKPAAAASAAPPKIETNNKPLVTEIASAPAAASTASLADID